MGITLIDALFILPALALVLLALGRRWAVSPPEPAPPVSVGEVVLTGLALVAPAIGPNILVVALTPGMPGMPTLVRWALLPSALLLLVVWAIASLAGYGRLANRIWTGLWVGAVATAALDVPRLLDFKLNLLSANLPRMFGVLILNTMSTGPTPLSDLVGYVYHYWISASLGLTYALLIGRTRWWGGLIWGLIIEVGMMTTPPMVIAMDTGYFGLKLGHGILNGVFIGSLIPHIVYGAVLGLLLERYLRHQGTVFDLVSEAWSSLRYGPTASRAQI